jgi:hypothetical protein
MNEMNKKMLRCLVVLLAFGAGRALLGLYPVFLMKLLCFACLPAPSTC